MRTAIGTGMRWGEILALKPEDIVQRGTEYFVKVRRVIIEVDHQQTERGYGKTTRAQRDISIDPELARDLLAAGPGFIFHATRGGKLTRSNFRRIWLAALKSAGITGVRVHDMRHTHASWLVNGGADLVTVRDRLGHSDIAITSRYLHRVDNGTDPALDALSIALRAA